MGKSVAGLGDGDGMDLEVVWAAERYQRWIVDTFGDAIAGDVLEVGAGVGAITRWLAPRALRVVALEPDPERAGRLRGLGLENVAVIDDDLRGLSERGETRYDAAVLVNVIEHIDDDVDALRRIHDLLVPGGRVCIFAPAHRGLFGTLDERYGHRRRYTTRSVDRLLRRTGFTPERLRYFNPLGAPGWLLLGRVLRRPRISPFAVGVAERLVVPASQALERLGDPPFGQSVIAVGRREP